jgi:quercetin dioxygenase-like cupin family protein
MSKLTDLAPLLDGDALAGVASTVQRHRGGSMRTAMKLVGVVLAVATLARADDAPPSGEEVTAVDLASAKWKPAPKPIPEGVMVAPIAVNPETKGSVGYAKIPAGLVFPEHWHSHAEYTVFLSGKATFMLDGKAHDLSPGSYVVIPAKTKHSLSCGPDADCILFTRRAGPTDYNWVK